MSRPTAHPTCQGWSVLTIGSLCLAYILSNAIFYLVSPQSERTANLTGSLFTRCGSFVVDKSDRAFLDVNVWTSLASDEDLGYNDFDSVSHVPQALCTMETCFDFSRCKGDFKVIYRCASDFFLQVHILRWFWRNIRPVLSEFFFNAIFHMKLITHCLEYPSCSITKWLDASKC